MRTGPTRSPILPHVVVRAAVGPTSALDAECVAVDFYAGVLPSVMAWVPMTTRSLSLSAASLLGAAV